MSLAAAVFSLVALTTPSSPPAFPTIAPPDPTDLFPEKAAGPSIMVRPPPSSESHGSAAAAAHQGKKPTIYKSSNSSNEAVPAPPEFVNAIASLPAKVNVISLNPNPCSEPMERGSGGRSSGSGDILANAVPELPSPYKSSNNWDNGPRSSGYMSGDHHRSFSVDRRGGGGGGGHHHNSFGNRHDQQWRDYDGNLHWSFGGMRRPPPPMQQWRHPWPPLRPPPPPSAPAQFAGLRPPAHPFVNPMRYPDIPSHVYYASPHGPYSPPLELLGVVPFVTGPIPHAMPTAMHSAVPDHLRGMLVEQIDYYFSPNNLCKDIHLRRHMDDHGWVSIYVIAAFNRVTQLTNSVQYILDALRSSRMVEVQGDKIRCQRDRAKWILPSHERLYITASGTLGYEAMVASVRRT